MAQSTLTPGPGTLVRDALAPVLATLTNAASTVTGAWTNVEFPDDVSVWWDGGAIAGADDTVDIAIEAADDASGTNTVVLGNFTQLGATDDSVTRVLRVNALKPYMRAVATIAGSSPDVSGTITLRQPHDRQSATQTG